MSISLTFDMVVENPLQHLRLRKIYKSSL